MRQSALFPTAYEPDPARVLFPRVVSVRDGSTRYACPDPLWSAHMKAWRRARQAGQTGIAEPMPAGHCMFENPIGYACVPYGSTDAKVRRRAIRASVRADLYGWDRDVPARQLARIVRATVNARMAGQSTGAWPFIACVSAGV